MTFFCEMTYISIELNHELKNAELSAEICDCRICVCVNVTFLPYFFLVSLGRSQLTGLVIASQGMFA